MDMSESHTVIVRPMTTLPTKSGRYPVFHRGRVAGDAYFWTQEDLDSGCYRTDEMGLVAGWQQLPPWGPTHWIDVSTIDIPSGATYKCFWANKNGFPTKNGQKPSSANRVTVPKKEPWWKRFLPF